MSSYIPTRLRNAVKERARECCEYCQLPEVLSFYTFEIEHIISEKHGGITHSNNLALACFYCNRYKGTDLGSIDRITNLLTPFFNPRTQTWEEHFQWQGAIITPLTAEGRVTERILQFNHPDRLSERERYL